MSNKYAARKVANFEPVYKLTSLTNAEAEFSDRKYKKAVERITFNKKELNERHIFVELGFSSALIK